MPARKKIRVSRARTKRVISLLVTLVAAIAMLAMFADKTTPKREKACGADQQQRALQQLLQIGGRGARTI